MAQRVCVIDVPGLNHELLAQIPGNSALGKWLAKNRVLGLTPSPPSVTASVQATLTTGVAPAKHGIISDNLRSFRSHDSIEPSNQDLEVPRIWQDSSGKSRVRTALIFMQNSTPGVTGTPKPAADVVVAPMPRPLFVRAMPRRECWSEPNGLSAQLSESLGEFPSEKYAGPQAGIESSQWIANAAVWVWQHQNVQLQWVCIPHLTFELTRFGPNSPEAAKAVADVSAALEPLIQAVTGDGGKILLLGEYEIRAVSRSERPNQLLAEAGMLTLNQTPDGHSIDYARSAAYAIVDHQFANVYTSDPEATKRAMDVLHPIARCWTDVQEGAYTMSWKSHRAGNFVLEAMGDAWFDYRWWNDPAAAPRVVHDQPGFDPLELFASQDASVVKGSNGVVSNEEAIIAGDLPPDRLLYLAVEVADLVMKLVG